MLEQPTPAVCCCVIRPPLNHSKAMAVQFFNPFQRWASSAVLLVSVFQPLISKKVKDLVNQSVTKASHREALFLKMVLPF